MDFFSPELQAVLKDAIAAVLVALAALVGWGLKEVIALGKLWVQEKIGEQQLARVVNFLEWVVRGLAQDPVFSKWTAEEVKDYALQLAIGFCERCNLPFSDQELNVLIEGVYNEFKEFFGGSLPKRPAK